jgi:hypothetical protein
MGSLIFQIAAGFIAGEIIIHIFFFAISRMIGKSSRDKISLVSILKGLLERIFVVVSLWFDMTASLTLLGALKIATRIRDTEDKVSNDFFVIGNIVSVLFGIGYCEVLKYIVCKHL